MSLKIEHSSVSSFSHCPICVKNRKFTIAKLACGKCFDTYYCSKEHRNADLKQHKLVCLSTNAPKPQTSIITEEMIAELEIIEIEAAKLANDSEDEEDASWTLINE